jgi:hypothetical protein
MNCPHYGDRPHDHVSELKPCAVCREAGCPEPSAALVARYDVRRARKSRKRSNWGPSLATLERWLNEGGAEATDGCWVEPDGTCEHGCESWLLVKGLI